MSGISYFRPELVWFFPIVIGVVLLWQLVRRRPYVASTIVSRLPRSVYRASFLRRLPGLFVLLGLAFVTAAIMDPRTPLTERVVQSRGLDIVLVLDLSSSMQEIMDWKGVAPPPVQLASQGGARPAGKTRLETTKDALRDFIRHRPDDRIGLIVFSDNAYLVSPLTFDHEYLQHYVGLVDENILRGEGMTAIGEGVGLANYLLARQSEGAAHHSRVIVVFTDGENNFGRDPIDALTESDAAGIRVHVVGVDIEDEIKERPEVRRLIETVRRFGGRYYSADTVRLLQAAYRDIDSLEKTLLTSKSYVRNEPVYHWFAIPALICLSLAFIVRAVPYFASLS